MLKISLLVLLLCVTCQVTLSFTDGLVANGGFEFRPLTLQSSNAQAPVHNDIPEWDCLGSVECVEAGQNQGDMIIVIPEGRFALRLGSNSSVKQKLTIQQGKFYSVTFSAARTCGQDVFLNISVSPSSKFGDFGLLPIQTTYSSLGWDFYSWAFVAESNDTVLTIHNPSMEEEDISCGPIVDTIALKILHNPKRTRTNMLKNGDFEEGPFIFPNTSVGVLIPSHIEDSHCPLRGWIMQSLKAVKYIDSDHFTVPEGKRAIELVGGRESAIAQIVRTQPGKNYQLSFFVGDAGDNCEGSFEVEAFAGNKTVHVGYESKGTGGFERVSFKFEAVSDRTRIRFLSSNYFMKNDYSGSMCGPVIDGVKLLGLRKH